MPLQFQPIVLGVVLAVTLGVFIYNVCTNTHSNTAHSYGQTNNHNYYDYNTQNDQRSAGNSGTQERKKRRSSASTISSGDNSCVICLESLKSRVVKLLCDHSFHINCIQKWINKSPGCPVCRRPI